MLRRIAFTAAAIALTSACAVAAPSVTPVQASAIEASCTSIMGLRPGEFAYIACRDSLRTTAAGLSESQARLSSYDACRARGLAPGSAAHSTCMLNGEPAALQPVSMTAAPAAVPASLVADTSYYNVTHAVQWRRAQYACAQLGLVPGSATFTHCVASLDADMQP